MACRDHPSRHSRSRLARPRWHAIAFATTSPPAVRFEGFIQTIARVSNIETALAAIAQAQAQTSTSIVQLTASVAALVQRAGILHALPPAPPPAAPA
jgi:hypothetical protein